MATKYYDTTLELLTSVGMSAAESKTVARLANSHVQACGLSDCGVAEFSDKGSTKSKVVTGIIAKHERKLKKDELLTVGEVAFKFVSQVNVFANEWPGTVTGISLPSGLSKVHMTYAAEDAKRAAAKEEAEKASGATK